jgi:CrcB protein
VAIALAVGVAGAIGAVARYLLDGAVQDRTSGLFPYGTLTVNVTGSLLLGLLAGLVIRNTGSGDLKTIVGTGFCGGLTTFSTMSWETIRLIEEAAPAVATRYVLVTLVSNLLAAAVGLVIVLR